MDVKHLDVLIPTHRVLRLRDFLCFLPFIAKPFPIYYKLREFIDEQKHEPTESFELSKLFKLFVILSDYYRPNLDYKVSVLIDNIMLSIILNQNTFIKSLSIETLINYFYLKINPSILYKFLDQLPDDFFKVYIYDLSRSFIEANNTNLYYKKHIECIESLSHQFGGNEKLKFFVLAPSDLISDKYVNLEKLIEIKSLYVIDFLKILLGNLKIELFDFIIKWKKNINKNDNFFYTILLDNTDAIDILNENFLIFYTQYSFNQEKNITFSEALIQIISHNKTTLEKKICLDDKTTLECALERPLLTQKQKYEFISQLIIDYFTESNKKLLCTDILRNNLENQAPNLFQAIAILYITICTTQDTISIKNLDKLAKKIDHLVEKYLAFLLQSPDLEVFSPRIQVCVLKGMLECMYTYINDRIIQNTENHSDMFKFYLSWKKFTTDEGTVPASMQVLRNLFEKIPKNLKIREKNKLNFFSELYYYFHSPHFKKIRAMVATDKCTKSADQQGIVTQNACATAFFAEVDEKVSNTPEVKTPRLEI